MTTQDLTRTPEPLLRRARMRFVIVAIVVPVMVTALTAVIIGSWLADFPDPVITHWGVSGADGFGPASTYLWLVLLLGAALPVVFAVSTLTSVGTHWGAAARLMGSFSAGMAMFGALTGVGSLWIQREGVESAPGAGGVIAVSFAGLIVVGAAAWAFQPRVQPVPGRTLESRHVVSVNAGERVVWVGTASMSRGARAALIVLLAGLVALAVYMLVTGVEGGWIVAATTVVVAFAFAATTAFRVRITPEGFDARALIGWPRQSIPTAEVESVRAVDISPFGEFGGWGWRVAVDGRRGIVVRRGPAIEVSRKGKPPFIVTIDGAEVAAALLSAYVDRARSGAPTQERENR